MGTGNSGKSEKGEGLLLLFCLITIALMIKISLSI
jgi:hypothetical protein